MPSSYTTNGGIEKIATGEQSGTWGTTTNTNFDIIDRLSSGVGTITLSGATHTLTTTDGALSEGMYKVLVLSGGTEACTVTVAPNDAQKVYFVNNTTSYTATFSQGTGSNVAVPAGEKAILYCDGAGSTAAVVEILGQTDLTGYLQASNNLSDVSSASTARTNLGLGDAATGTIGTNVQAYDAGLQSISGLTTAADKMIYATASDTYAVTTLTSFARTLLDDADAASVVSTLGITASVAELNYNDITTLGTSEASKVVTADSNGDVFLSEELKAKSYNDTYAAVTSSSNATTINCETGNVFTHVLTEATTFTFSNPPATGTAYSFSLKMVQDSSASTYLVTWPTSVDWPLGAAPSLSVTADAVDQLVFYTHDGGTTWYGFLAGKDLS
jgi:hypothetical protein